MNDCLFVRFENNRVQRRYFVWDEIEAYGEFAFYGGSKEKCVCH